MAARKGSRSAGLHPYTDDRGWFRSCFLPGHPGGRNDGACLGGTWADGRARAGRVPVVRPLSWRVRTTLLIGTVGPLVASLVLMMNTYLPLCVTQRESFDVPCFMAAFVLFAIPVGYVFGLVPAVLAGVMFCAAVNGMAPLRPGVLARACLAAVSGELAARRRRLSLGR